MRGSKRKDFWEDKKEKRGKKFDENRGGLKEKPKPVSKPPPEAIFGGKKVECRLGRKSQVGLERPAKTDTIGQRGMEDRVNSKPSRGRIRELREGVVKSWRGSRNVLRNGVELELD